MMVIGANARSANRHFWCEGESCISPAQESGYGILGHRLVPGAVGAEKRGAVSVGEDGRSMRLSTGHLESRKSMAEDTDPFAPLLVHLTLLSPACFFSWTSTSCRHHNEEDVRPHAGLMRMGLRPHIAPEHVIRRATGPRDTSALRSRPLG